MSIDDVALASLVAPLRDAPDATVLAFDFDGTLAAVVDDPAAAVPIPGVPALLDELAGRYRRVVAISGRPVGFLARHLPGTVALSGLYGLESLVDGVVADHPDAAAWRPVVHEAASEAEQVSAPGAPLDGMLVEPKGLSLTLHVRTRPELEPAALALARSLVLNPEVFLFDEPFGALDEITRARLNLVLQDLFLTHRFAGLFVTHSVEEAVFLANRVVVMSARPGRIVAEFEVPFPFPRDHDLRYQPEFASLAGLVAKALEEAS